VIARRERTIAIVPMGRGLVAHTLHEARDLHDPAALFARIPELDPDSEMVALATQLIDRQTARFDPSDMEDRYEKRLRDLIAAKLEGEGLEAEPEDDADRGNVVDLMAALKQSLAGSEAEAPRPAGRAAKERKAPAKSKTAAEKAAAAGTAPPRRRRA
jgi:DNA end-binding protein Ku